MKNVLIISEDEKFQRSFKKKRSCKIFVGGKYTKKVNKLDCISNIDACTNNLPDFLYASDEVIFSDQFITYLNKHELFAFDFMSNTSVDGLDLDYKDLRFYFHAIIYKWLGVIKKKKIDHIITDKIPNRIYSYCIYIISKFSKIKFTIVKKVPSILGRDKFHLIENYGYNETFNGLTHRFKKQKDPLLLNLREKNNYYSPDEMNNNNFNFEEKILLDFSKLNDLKGTVGEANKIKKFFYIKKNKKQKKNSIEYYNKAVSNFQKKKNYIFFSNKINSKDQILNHNFYYDLKFALEFILNIMPKDWIIYFQEDSPVSAFNRYYGENFKLKSYYEEILLLSKRIKFLDTDTPIVDLIKNAKVVGTINGDEAWISVMNKIPSFNFIQTWYNQSGLVSFIKNSQNMSHFFENYAKIKESLSINKVHNFNKTFLSKSSSVKNIDKIYNKIIEEKLH